MLEAKREKYCQLRASGKSQRQAYLEAFPSSRKWKPETVDNKAYALEKTNEILARLREINEDNAERAGLSRKNLLDRLEEIINSDDVMFKGNDVIKAIEIYADMCGYKVDKENENGQLEQLIEGLKTNE